MPLIPRENILAFADKHLQPYRIHGDELQTEFCPICNGGDHGDKWTFSLNMEECAGNCRRGSCGWKGTFSQLARVFGEQVKAERGAFQAAKVAKHYDLPDPNAYSPPTEKIYSYFQSRSISKSTVDDFHIQSDKDGNIVFPFYRDGALIYVKYREPELDKNKRKRPGKEWAMKNTCPILFGMDLVKPKQPLVITEGQCFPGDAEIMTRNGWVRLDEYDCKSEILAVDEHMGGMWSIPYAYINKEYDGDLLECRIGGNYTSIVTPDHNIVTMTRGGAIVKQPAWRIMQYTGLDRHIPTTIRMDGPGIPLSNDAIALYLAVSADGSMNSRTSWNHVRFAVKKERKYIRIKQILDRLDIEYHDSGLLSSGYYYVGFKAPEYVPTKTLPYSWVADATVEQRKFIIDEMQYWDGNSVKGRKQLEYASISYHNASVIQAIAHTCGMMSTIIARPKRWLVNGEERHSVLYKVSILLSKSYVTTQQMRYSPVPYHGRVYCVSVPTGMILVRQEGHITVTGNCDCMSLYEAGVRNVLSVPSGCDNMEWVETCWDWLEKFDEIILFGDNDDPGRKMVQTLLKRLGEYRCRTVSDYPVNPKKGAECKDANEILVRCGDLSLLDMVENAKAVPVHGLIDLADVQIVDPTTVERIKTGIPALDNCINGLKMGSITVLTGKAGEGKSTLVGLLALEAVSQNYSVCMYSGEMNASEVLNWITLQAAGSDYTTLKWDALRNKQVPVVPLNVQERIREWFRGRIWLFDSTEVFESSEADAILNVFQIAARRFGCKIFFVD